MKKTAFFTCLLFAVLALVSCAQNKKTAAATPATPAPNVAIAPTPAPAPAPAMGTNPDANKTGGPVMTFDFDDLDYGTINQGDEPLRLFTFTNTGNAPLQITSAKGSCGCTVPTYPKEEIKPGEKSKIEVRYDTNRIGQFQKTVTLTTNEADGANTHILKIHGLVNAKPTDQTAPAAPQGGGH